MKNVAGAWVCVLDMRAVVSLNLFSGKEPVNEVAIQFTGSCKKIFNY